eukprot:scaffold24154_cov78-Skeletonema_dohrnii-CCMP3373.AAC.1
MPDGVSWILPTHQSSAATKKTASSTATKKSAALMATKKSASASAADVLAAAAPLEQTTNSSTAPNESTKKKGGVVDLTQNSPGRRQKNKKQKVLPFAKGPTKKSNENAAKRTSKPPKRFTMKFKKEVLDFLDTPGNSVRAAMRRFEISKQNISNWKKSRPEIEKACKMNPNAKRANSNDPLLRIKIGILAFYELNQSMPKDGKINITGAVISARAKLIRDRLIEKHKESPFLTDHEVKGMNDCKFSDNWGMKVARMNGWKSRALHGEAGSVDVEACTPKIEEICTLIAEYDLDHVYNMDETGLFFKCLPNRSYVKKEHYKNARGTKLMKAKDRTTVYVCTNASGTDKVPLSIIGKAKTPRCFVRRKKKLKYYSQARAWSDTVTFHKWWRDFLNHIRRKTTKKVLLILDNCGPHGAELIDPRGQVTVIFLPPNCTSMFQPMDAGVIAMLKKNYRTKLLMIMLETYDDRENLRRNAEKMLAGTKGLSEGYPPHLRDVMDILFEVWEEVDPSAIRRCWIKSQLIGSDDVAPSVANAADTTAASSTAATASSATAAPTSTGATTTNTTVDTADESAATVAAASTEERTTAADDRNDDDQQLNDMCELVSKFAASHRDIQRTNVDMSEYDIMINEMVVTLNTKDCEDKREMMNAWMEMEDNDFCKGVLCDEVEEVMNDADALLDLQYMAGDDDDEGGEEVVEQPAPKVQPTAERLVQMAEELKAMSIEADTFE